MLDLAMVDLVGGDAKQAESRLRDVRDRFEYLEQSGEVTSIIDTLVSSMIVPVPSVFLGIYPPSSSIERPSCWVRNALVTKGRPRPVIFRPVELYQLQSLSSSLFSASILGLIALSTIPTRQILMPVINAATDAKLKRRFVVLHGLSVVITLVHIVAVGFVIVDLAGQ
jgi:hypothetical protein